MIPNRYALAAAASTLAMAVGVLLPAPPATAAATVEHPECFFEPGDIPGVDVFFPATCTIVTSDSGITTVVGRAQLPDGYTLSETFVGTLPCFGGIGRVTATVSGRVNATCHLEP
jgi:hypothetical protein